MNGFQQHGIQHTSPSQINLWANAPDVWVMEKLFGKKGKPGAAMHRGICTEMIVANVLSQGHSFEQASQMALQQFDRAFALYNDPKKASEREAIIPCAELAINELKQYGAPEFPDHGGQHEIALLCKGDNWELPVKGFLDLVYPKHGLVVDLKTTLRIPSEMSKEHQRQAAIYRKAQGNHAVKFLYVSPKKAQWHEVEDIAPVLAEVKQILNRQERFLRISNDKQFLADIVPVMTNSYYYSGPVMEALRKELFGI